MDGRSDDEVVAYKTVWVGFECSKWFTKRLLALDSREASMDTAETLYQFDILLSDNRFFMSEAITHLLEGEREVWRNSLKTVQLWIAERDSSVLKGRWLVQVETLGLL